MNVETSSSRESRSITLLDASMFYGGGASAIFVIWLFGFSPDWETALGLFAVSLALAVVSAVRKLRPNRKSGDDASQESNRDVSGLSNDFITRRFMERK